MVGWSRDDKQGRQMHWNTICNSLFLVNRFLFMSYYLFRRCMVLFFYILLYCNLQAEFFKAAVIVIC